MKKQPIQVKPMQPHTLRWWRNRHKEIDVSPPYQRRGRLWSQTDKAYLIDSILNGFDMPKLYLADFTYGDSPLNARRKPYAIIDGKQRLEAIMDFFSGNLTLNDDFVLLEDTNLQLGGLSYKDLQANFADVAERFDEFELPVMSVITKNKELINELFVRLNRSKPLTGAEIRNAMKGPAPQIIRQIAKHEFFRESIKFEVSRGADLNAAAKILSFEYHNELRASKKRDLDEFVNESARASKEKLKLAGREVLDVLESMAEIFLPRDRLLVSAGVVPVFYWFIRNCNESEYATVREFLVRFEEERTINRELVRDQPDSKLINSELHEYDQYNRSTNDQRSHTERLRILTKRFAAYAKSKSWKG